MIRSLLAGTVHSLAILAGLHPLPLSAQASPPADFDAYLAAALDSFATPGAAIAVVKDGRVVHAKGYGLRRLGQSTPVDAHTLCQIASNTKAFTTAALAMLVDEGKLAWNDPVTKHIPWFQLSDPYVTRELTVRDLLVHRSGLGLGAGEPALVPCRLPARQHPPSHPLRPSRVQLSQRVRLRQRALRSRG